MKPNYYTQLTTHCILLVLFTVFMACKDDEEPTPETGTISGKITDSVTGLAIEGANVQTQPGTSSVNSSSNGDYTITNVTAGSYTVTASKADYISTDVNINVAGGSTTTANIALTPITTNTNNPPDKPQNVAPSSGSGEQPTSVTLSWTGSDPDGDALTYEIFFGSDNPPTTSVSSGSSGTELVQDNLSFSTTYYWQVNATDVNGATTTGDVWEFTTASAPAAQEVFFEDFESGIGNWSADNGQWQVGQPIVGPTEAFSGQQLAGTILDGEYSNDANTRLISPNILLPNLEQGESIQLKFWHWYVFQSFEDDFGNVQISVDGGEWQTITSQSFDAASAAWTQGLIDLSTYAGSSIRIAFQFISDIGITDIGWYIDDVLVEKKVVSFNNPEDFEQGVGDWGTDNGQWQVGQALVGPSEGHSGEYVAGTVLDGNYHDRANSRFISPSIILPDIVAGEQIVLKSWHWFIMDSFNDDFGSIQISVDGGEWLTISNENFDGSSAAWTQNITDLTDYAGQDVKIAFLFTSNIGISDIGWYIDDVSIEKIQ